MATDNCDLSALLPDVYEEPIEPAATTGQRPAPSNAITKLPGPLDIPITTKLPPKAPSKSQPIYQPKIDPPLPSQQISALRKENNKLQQTTAGLTALLVDRERECDTLRSKNQHYRHQTHILAGQNHHLESRLRVEEAANYYRAAYAPVAPFTPASTPSQIRQHEAGRAIAAGVGLRDKTDKSVIRQLRATAKINKQHHIARLRDSGKQYFSGAAAKKRRNRQNKKAAKAAAAAAAVATTSGTSDQPTIGTTGS